MNDYLIIGLNHKTAPVGLREQLAFPPEELSLSLKKLLSLDYVEEGLILSTCNRVVFYAAAKKKGAAAESIRHFLAEEKELNPEEVYPHLYHHFSLDAIRHLFRVSASLDSMVVGETQITGQVKKAFSCALDLRSTGSYLNRLMNRALFVSKKIRTETEISHHPVSVGQAAVSLTEKIFEDISSKKICLVGAGKMGGLVLERLRKRGAGEIILLNRTFSKAKFLADQNGGSAAPLSRLKEILEEVDVVITSAEVQQPIIASKKLQAIMKTRKNRPIFLIDLGVPRNIDPLVTHLENVYLYNIDDLQKIVEASFKARKEEATKAEQIVCQEAQLFYERILTPQVPLQTLRIPA